MWIIPGDRSEDHKLEVDFLSSTRKIYVKGKRKVKSKTVADVVEALIGAFLSTGGEVAALLFMDWLGIQVDFVNIPYERQFRILPGIPINIPSIESLLNYRFNDPSLLVEALTHGSYMMLEIPGCYQVLLDFCFRRKNLLNLTFSTMMCFFCSLFLCVSLCVCVSECVSVWVCLLLWYCL